MCYAARVRFEFDRRKSAVFFEPREDHHGEYYRLITVWKATRVEHALYERASSG